MNKSHRGKIQNLSSITSSSPVSFVSRAFSPGANAFMLPPKGLKYKSPNSTPTTSPLPGKVVSTDEFSKCFSEKKKRDSDYYLKQKIMLQDKRIFLLEDENKRLLQMKAMNWNEREQKKIEYKVSATDENDKLLDKIVEKDNKISKLESDLQESKQKCEEVEKSLATAKKDNAKLNTLMQEHQKCLKKSECELLLRQIEDLEVSLESQSKEIIRLRSENNKGQSEINSGSLIYFSQDINRICREMNKLERITNEFVQGKEITLKGLLDINFEGNPDPVQQLSADIFSIKRSLNRVLGMISDFHAEQCANFTCKTQ